METKVYVDILLVLNYIINILLILCTAKITGKNPERRRIVAAALLGAGGSLTIFLPFFGFFISLLLKLAISAGMVLTAFSYISFSAFAKQLFALFTVSFFFAGVMLAVRVTLSPGGMVYYNGVVYFNLSPAALIVTTTAAYALLTLAQRLARKTRLKSAIYRCEIIFRGKTAVTSGLVDTGNSLYEPFSGTPVIVCRASEVTALLPEGAAEAILSGGDASVQLSAAGIPLRLVPFRHVGGGGAIPAFKPDRLLLTGPEGPILVENVYVGVSAQTIGGDGFGAILNPDLIGVKILQGGAGK